MVDLPNGQVPVDVRQAGNQILLDFMRTGAAADAAPPPRRDRLRHAGLAHHHHASRATACTWWSTPRATGSRACTRATPSWSSTSSRSRKTRTGRPAAPQGYRGEKLSFNFQNVEVRAALQAIADISGLNIITSDSVGGNLTLRLKDVPWDQALDVIMQAKGLDMRKNGNVLWIAPKEELLTKEKLELEQQAQIADLEPLRSEVFQLNYQKADAFRTVFGLDAGAGGGGGSATACCPSAAAPSSIRAPTSCS